MAAPSLLPQASQVPEGGIQMSTCVPNVVPATTELSDSFYDFQSTLLEEHQQRGQRHQQQQQQQQQQQGWQRTQQQEAVILPQFQGYPEFVSDSDRSKVARAQQSGRFAAAMESRAIRRSNQDVGSLDSQVRKQIRQANEHAQRQERMQKYGSLLYSFATDSELSMELQPSQTAPTPKLEKDKKKKAKGGNPSASNQTNAIGGYQVTDYEVSDYQVGSSYTASEYQFSDYKSVYE